MIGGMIPQAFFIVATVAFLATDQVAVGFQFQSPPKIATSRRRSSGRCTNNDTPRLFKTAGASYRPCPHHLRHKKISTKLHMVRNIDLPEVLVFYGLESIMTQQIDENSGEIIVSGDDATCVLRPGIARLLNECQEVGTGALLLSEEIGDEESAKLMFQRAWGQSTDIGGENVLDALMKGEESVINFRCLSSKFTAPISVTEDASESDQSDEDDGSIEFYNIQTYGRSPSPAFLLDSLNSVHIDPRGFGGSSGFGRGQWIEPRRSPMPARTVVFIAGDWASSSSGQSLDYGDEDDTKRCTVKDRCAAARAAGCRVIYLEQPFDQTQQQHIDDDAQTMNLCDAVIDTFGNDNPRDLQPITLDAISTPGDYWLNPPTPRDDVGNGVAADEIVEWFRSEREMAEVMGDQECVVVMDAEEEEEMSEDEMAKILADLDGL